MDAVVRVASLGIGRDICCVVAQGCGGLFSRLRIAAEKKPPVQVTANVRRRRWPQRVNRTWKGTPSTQQPQPAATGPTPQMPSSRAMARRMCLIATGGEAGPNSLATRRNCPWVVSLAWPAYVETQETLREAHRWARRSPLPLVIVDVKTPTSVQLRGTVLPTSCGCQDPNTTYCYFTTPGPNQAGNPSASLASVPPGLGSVWRRRIGSRSGFFPAKRGCFPRFASDSSPHGHRIQRPFTVQLCGFVWIVRKTGTVSSRREPPRSTAPARSALSIQARPPFRTRISTPAWCRLRGSTAATLARQTTLPHTGSNSRPP
jgi:hypothetical protein